MSTKVFTGNVYSWNVFGNECRNFSVFTLPYVEAREYFMPIVYNALKKTGECGEQREIYEPHAKKLKKVIAEGNYTPTPISVSLSKKQRTEIKYYDDNTFSVEVDSENPCPQVDGGHRFAALDLLYKETKDKLGKSTDSEIDSIKEIVYDIENLPITVIMYLNGDSQIDFVNLQSGRTVDSSHMLSLKIQRKIKDDENCLLAFNIAKCLHTNNDSPFSKRIKFDSRGSNPLPISTLCSTGSSDIATSLVGLAKIGRMEESDVKSDVWLAEKVCYVYSLLLEKSPNLLQYGKFLTSLDNQGSKGSQTMLVGISSVLIFDLIMNGENEVSEEKANKFIDACNIALSGDVSGNFSGPVKRQLIGQFVREYFSEYEKEKVDGIPTTLLELLSYSTFGLTKPEKVKESKLPKEPKVKKPPKEPKVKKPPKEPKPKKAKKPKKTGTAGGKRGRPAKTKTETPEVVGDESTTFVDESESAPWEESDSGVVTY